MRTQLDGATAMVLVGTDPQQAEFIRSESDLAQEKEIEALKKKGFKVETPNQRMVDREEFQAAIEARRKPKKWPIVDADA